MGHLQFSLNMLLLKCSQTTGNTENDSRNKDFKIFISSNVLKDYSILLLFSFGFLALSPQNKGLFVIFLRRNSSNLLFICSVQKRDAETLYPEGSLLLQLRQDS